MLLLSFLLAWLCGEQVFKVVLHPLAISRTDTSHDRHPLLVAWGGPVVGSIVPLTALGVARIARLSWWYLVQFFAGFCLLTNGLYLAAGSVTQVGDAADVIRYGGSTLSLFLFGLATAPLGLCLWNGLGPHFGLGESKGAVSRKAAVGTLIVLIALMTIEVWVFGLAPGK